MGLDVHRSQITVELLDSARGEVRRDRIVPGTRAALRRWLAPFEQVALRAALEGTTGWRFVVEELQAIGAEVHLAEPCETRRARGRKQRAKTDRADAQHLRVLLQRGELPESWIPPAWIRDLRIQVRQRHTLVAQRSAWQQRIQAVLFHHGLPKAGTRTAAARERLAALSAQWPPAAQQLVACAQRVIAQLDAKVATLDAELQPLAQRHPACQALAALYGVGRVLALSIFAELGEVGRFRNSRQVVRWSGLDITVEQSDRKRRPGKLSRQGAPVLPWAVVEAAQCACRPGSPDYPRYQVLRARHGHNRACLILGRSILKRAYHQLRKLEQRAALPAAA
jgi:transposase